MDRRGLPGTGDGERRFSLAVIPDSQNYLDHTHQRSAGFPFDAHDMLDAQLGFAAAHARGNGGPVAFVAGVGDTWQHPSLAIDPASAVRGYSRVANPWLLAATTPTRCTRSVEMPRARDAWSRLAGIVPFGVAPGNHDYDATFSDARWQPAEDAADIDPDDPHSIGMLHVGGLDNFRQVFGASSPFFREAPWYVSSFRGGADSAQVFCAGGYTFLHLALELHPTHEALAWAAGVMDLLYGLPTIVSTHDFLDTRGRREPWPVINTKLVDPAHHDAEDMWDGFVRLRDQVFLVLCGHHHGEASRVDDNAHGHPVVQLLADYQDRCQVSQDKGLHDRVPLGDGWMRLLEFDMGAETPSLHVRTYSTHYRAYSTELPRYAAWYKEHEAPELSDEAFLAKGDFVLRLDGFRRRFQPAPEEDLLLATVDR